MSTRSLTDTRAHVPGRVARPRRRRDRVSRRARGAGWSPLGIGALRAARAVRALAARVWTSLTSTVTAAGWLVALWAVVGLGARSRTWVG